MLVTIAKNAADDFEAQAIRIHDHELSSGARGRSGPRIRVTMNIT
jgi:hypothetical protein